jgi:hypothetical protein
MRMYFNENPIFSKHYFSRRFWMSINFFKRIAAEVAKFDRFFSKGGMPPESLGIAPTKR